MTEGGLFAGVLARGAVEREVGDRAWLEAMLDAEAALARALASCGVVEAEAAEAVAAACDASRFDVAALGEEAARTGTPVVALVAALRAAVGSPAAAAAVHRGATSQDIVDTAAMLVARRALGPLLEDLGAAAGAAAALARAHRDTPIAGRTLLQQAVPVTFGFEAATWLTGLDDARRGLVWWRDSRAAAQLGGAAGTLAAYGDRALGIRAAFARELGLREPVMTWHTARGRIGELAGALGVAAGSVGKAAQDVVLLSQTELGEVREASGGGSSAMPHKRNPVAAISALAGARQAPGLVSTLLASMTAEHQRAAGAWHAEWAPLRALLVACGSAAAWLRESLSGLSVDPGRMAADLDATGGRLLAERVVGALDGLDDARSRVGAAAEGDGSFAEALAGDPEIAARLSREEIAGLLDPAGALGAAGELVDRALRAHEEG